MKTPIKILKDRKAEIRAEYDRVMSIEYGNHTGGGSHNSTYRKQFNETKQNDLARINKHLTEYTEAINCLEAIKRGGI